MKKSVLSAILLSLAISVPAQKTVYIPSFITREGINLNDPSSKWSYSRSKESENIVVFWEPGFGNDPSSASGSYRVNMTNLLEVAEKSYTFYLDSLGFAVRGSSVLRSIQIDDILIIQHRMGCIRLRAG